LRWEPKDAVTVVTGASSGIGRCLAQRLVGRGATVIAVGRRPDRIDALRQGCGDHLIPVVGDITEPAIRDRIADAASAVRQGQIDLLVNNAGIGAIGPFDQATPDRLRRVMEVNFFAPVELTRQLLPQLKRGRAAVICNVGSVLGHRAVPNKSEYCASKFAIHGWSDALRAELAADGVQVTLVSPSTTKSDFFDSLIDTDPSQNSPSIGSWTPERVADKILDAIRARRSEVICSLAGKAFVYADRLAPPLMNAILRDKRK
jgi:short-subunit dehydrogenase